VSERGRASTPSRAKPSPLVLIAEDNVDTREMYAEYLNYGGLRVETACDGAEAVTKTRDLLPDLIVLDLTMPALSGWDVARVLRRSSATASIPILAVTGHALRGAEKTALEAGCNRLVTKPCLPQDLLANVLDLLNRRDAARAG